MKPIKLSKQSTFISECTDESVTVRGVARVNGTEETTTTCIRQLILVLLLQFNTNRDKAQTETAT